MATYRNPEDAFKHSAQKLRKGNAFLHIYQLDEKLKGNEIVVASSNNKAVENVSAELPNLEEVDPTLSELRYFKTTSDALHNNETWGMIAAVLGNSKNKYAFTQKFWWDDDCGIQKYLQQATGTNQFIDIETEDGIIQRPPKTVQYEDPPQNQQEAMSRWSKEVASFKSLKTKIESLLKELQQLSDLDKERKQLSELLFNLNEEIEPFLPQIAEKQESFNKEGEHWKQLSIFSAEQSTKLKESLRLKPNWFHRIFKTQKFKYWYALYSKQYQKNKLALQTEYKQAQVLEAVEEELLSLKAKLEKLKNKTQNLESKLKSNHELYFELSQKFKSLFVNDSFFTMPREKQQISAVWLNQKTAYLRHEMFVASMKVHKAFIDASAKCIRHNLNILMDGFGARSLGSPEKDALIPDIWSTLFLIVPVISTTFASVSKMFSKIPAEGLGWLLIDEAGQALPQAAVGAIMRHKKAVIVGDPIQIEPVVMLPEELTETICRRFGIDANLYNAPNASTQTLADSASEYYGTFETQYGSRDVGIPLLVHRRCSEPMFKISNSVAYENLMVQAKGDKPSTIRDTLGSSRWIHIEGVGQDKWCPNEGEEVLKILQNLKDKNCDPNLYIVTPFVVVQNRLRSLIAGSKVLENWVDNPWSWVYERIGTVHTVQGREAEAVIFVLGAPNANQTGARNWAGGRPNLLNVAITRAKEALYVIGNEKLWKEAGTFKKLHTGLIQ